MSTIDIASTIIRCKLQSYCIIDRSDMGLYPSFLLIDVAYYTNHSTSCTFNENYSVINLAIGFMIYVYVVNVSVSVF